MIGEKQQCIDWLLKEGQGIYKVQEFKETRSQAQNRLYHQWVGILVQAFGEKGVFITHDDLHEGLRDKLIEGEHHKNTFTGELALKRKSTTKLTKKEFNKYIEDIERYLWQNFEIAEPLPTDILFEQEAPRD